MGLGSWFSVYDLGLIIIMIIIIITATIFIVLSSWPGHCESSLGSSGECRASPSGRRPSDQATWLGLWVRLFLAAIAHKPASPFIIITQPESWYSFTVPQRVKGRVDLGTAGKAHTQPVSETANHSGFLMINTIAHSAIRSRTSCTAVRHARPLRPGDKRSCSAISITLAGSCLH